MDTNDQSASSTPSQNISDDSGNKEQSVSYDTHRKLLGQRKGDQATIQELSSALDVFKQAESKAAEEKLQDEGKFKEVIALRDAELKQTQEKYGSLKGEIDRARKLNAFDQTLGAKIKHEDFYNFVDTDLITLDENGVPMKESVELAVNSFKERYGDTLLVKTEVAKLPGDAPRNTTFQTGNRNKKNDWGDATRKFLATQKD